MPLARDPGEYTRIFATECRERLACNVAGFEQNDDELRKDTAVRSYADMGYALDVI